MESNEQGLLVCYFGKNSRLLPAKMEDITPDGKSVNTYKLTWKPLQ